MSAALRQACAFKADGSDFDPAILAAAFDTVMDGQAEQEEIERFLIATTPLSRLPEALAAGANALRKRMLPISAPPGAIDVCGTGGDGLATLNISTAAAFVAAGAGAYVAKHGNRAASSRSGAADVLEALGVRLDAPLSVQEQALIQAHVCFLFAQNHHPAMRHVAAARRALKTRTLFNFLGPLSNPASVKRQLVGVFSPDHVAPMTQALAILGAEAAIVVHGAGGMDEFSLQGANRMGEFLRGRSSARTVTPEEFGARSAPNTALAGGEPEENAAQLRALLDQRPSRNWAFEDAVKLNAAAALLVAGLVDTLPAGFEIAGDSLRSGRARDALEALIALTQDGRPGA